MKHRLTVTVDGDSVQRDYDSHDEALVAARDYAAGDELTVDMQRFSMIGPDVVCASGVLREDGDGYAVAEFVIERVES